MQCDQRLIGELITGLIRSLRPHHWTKNLLVFAGYIFTIQHPHPPGTFLRVVAAFAAFCAISGATYIVNDVADIERDRKHPTKCRRPIASGAVSPQIALMFSVVLGIAVLTASYWLDFYFGLLLSVYLCLALLYSALLKRIVIVDLLVIAAGFVIRAAAGAVVIHVTISPWLLVCTTLLALFLGLAKRRSELLQVEGSSELRETLTQYNSAMLDQMLSISAAACLMGYFLYTFSPSPITGETHPKMMATVPFVIYGIFRYLFLIHSRNVGETPEKLLVEDKPLLVNVILYVITAIAALKF